MEAKSLVQPNLEVPRIPKNKLEERQIQKSKQFTLPSGGGSSAKGNAIVAAVQLVGEVLQYWHGKKLITIIIQQTHSWPQGNLPSTIYNLLLIII